MADRDYPLNPTMLSHEQIMRFVERGRAERSRYISTALGKGFAYLRQRIHALLIPSQSLRLRHH